MRFRGSLALAEITELCSLQVLYTPNVCLRLNRTYSNCRSFNRPGAIYQYFNKAPSFQDKHFYSLVLFSLYPSLFWELRDKRNLENLQF